jgi:hypothetical protein
MKEEVAELVVDYALLEGAQVEELTHKLSKLERFPKTSKAFMFIKV